MKNNDDHPEFDFPEEKYPDAPGYMKESETSRQAASEIKLSAGSLRVLIYKFLKDHPSTCDEVEVALKLRHQTASARITELKLGKKIEARGTRFTRSGRRADVWFTL